GQRGQCRLRSPSANRLGRHAKTRRRPCFVQIASQLMVSDKPIVMLSRQKRGTDFQENSMSLDSDVIVDRRRIRRKLTFWRVAAAVVAIAAVVAVGLISAGGGGGAAAAAGVVAVGLIAAGGRGSLATGGSIARVNIEGLIRSDSDRVEALERLEKSQAVAGVVDNKSPGGTTPGA